MTQTTPDAVRSEIASILGLLPDSLSDTVSVGSIPEWDSLAQLAIITSLEEKFGLRIPEEIIMSLSCVGELIEYACGQNSIKTEKSADEFHVPEIIHQVQAPVNEVPRYDRQPIIQTICDRAEELPAKAALIFEHDSLTYRQLVRGIYKAATYLMHRGVKPGDVVALYAEKTREFFCFYFGVHLIGAAVLNLDPAIKEERRQFIFEQTRPVLTLGSGMMSDCCFNGIDLQSIEYERSWKMPDMQSIAEIMFTTGTTGSPKGVLLTHANIAASAYHINTFIGTHSGDVDAIALPVCHSFGIGRSRCVLAVGGTVVMAPGFSNPAKLYDILREYRVTGLALVPAAWAYLQRMSGNKISEYAESLRYIEIGGAPMPAKERQMLMKLFPHTRICIYYGLTEASRSTFMECHAEDGYLDSVGRASPGVDVRICDEVGREVPIGQEGEICIMGSHVMKGYLHDYSGNTFFGHYFRSGDWGKIDAEGYVTVSSRMKDMINVGGKKVSPEEVEGILNSIPGVAESACVPMPDPHGILGEVVKAVLVADPAFSKPADKDIMDEVATRLEYYKVPVAISWRDSLVRTGSGKIQRHLMQ